MHKNKIMTVETVEKHLYEAADWEPSDAAPDDIVERALTSRRTSKARRPVAPIFATAALSLCAALLVFAVVPRNRQAKSLYAVAKNRIRPIVAQQPMLRPARPKLARPLPLQKKVYRLVESDVAPKANRRAHRRFSHLVLANHREKRRTDHSPPFTSQWQVETVERAEYGLLTPAWVATASPSGKENEVVVTPAMVNLPLGSREEVVTSPTSHANRLTILPVSNTDYFETNDFDN